MIELPLFPLNSVLFPGMPLNLHIFEERYKLMINACIQERQPFGVVLIKSGKQEGGPLADPHQIGCTAQITQVQPLRRGEMHIAAVGRERFRIHSLRHDKPYLVGTVEMHPLEQESPVAITRAGAQLRRWVLRYLRVLEEAGQVQFKEEQIPDETLPLAYLSAVILQQVSMHQKQELLEANLATDMLRRLHSLYRREIALLKAQLNPPESTKLAGPFSSN